MTLADLLHDLGEVCACEDEQQDPRCLYCEARLQIEAQQRTIRLLEQRRIDAEAIAAVPALRDKKAVVLYFENDEDRDGLVELLQAAHPGMRAVNL